MRGLWFANLCLLISVALPVRAQNQAEWEIPNEIKGDLAKPTCPEGTQRDAQGWCVKQSQPTPIPPQEAPTAKPDSLSTTSSGESSQNPSDKTPESKPAAQPTNQPAPATSTPATTSGATSPDGTTVTRPPLNPVPVLAPDGDQTPGSSTSPPPPAPDKPVLPPTDKKPEDGAASAKPETPTPPVAPDAQTPTPPATGAAADASAEPPKTPADASAAPQTGEQQAAADSKRAFIKGELTNFVGSTKLVTKNNRIGVALGYRNLDLIHYATVSAEADIRIGELMFGLGVPLSFEIFNANLKDPNGTDLVGVSNLGKLRKEDWDEPGDFARIVRYLTWGRKEDRFFFNLSQTASATLGHGTLMRRYSVNIDPNSIKVSAELDAYNDYAGFEFVGNSIVDWDVFGTVAFVKPLSFFLDNAMARSVSLGFTYIADRHAPVTLETTSLSPYELVTENDRPKVVSSAFLHGMGVDLEMKVLKTANVDLKPYIDYSWFIPTSPSGGVSIDPEGGGGFTVGLLGRFNFGEDPVHALRTVIELRTFSSTYIPGYFDTFYEVQKFISNQSYLGRSCPPSTPNCLPPTKFTDVFVDRKGGSQRLGFYLEFSYALMEKIGLTLALEGSNATRGNHFLAHLEVPALSWLQFFISFHQRSMESVGDLFSNDSADKILFAALRLRALPFLFINARYFHTFEMQQGQQDFNGDTLEEQYNYYYPANGFEANIEFGWEF